MNTELEKLEKDLKERRATGRTYRIANEVIDDLMTSPMNSPILVIDHWRPLFDPRGRLLAGQCLMDLVVRRLKNDFPDIEIQCSVDWDGVGTITRKSPTKRERMVAEYKCLKKKE